jgi:hypothetical protein
MKKLAILFLGASFLLPFASQAREYGEAGCGLGSMLLHKDNQVLAATTNGTSYSQTFGISSGTSNCTDSGTVRNEAKVQLYIEANKLALAKDISRGQGESLSTLEHLLDCSGRSVGPVLQHNYGTIFPNNDVPAAAVSKSIRSILRQNAYQCSLLG